MTAKLRLSLKTIPAQTLMNQAEKIGIGGSQAVADFEQSLVSRLLKGDVVVKILHRVKHRLPVPGLGDPLLPGGIGSQQRTMVNVCSGTGDPDLRIRKTQLGVALTGQRQ